VDGEVEHRPRPGRGGRGGRGRGRAGRAACARAGGGAPRRGARRRRGRRGGAAGRGRCPAPRRGSGRSWGNGCRLSRGAETRGCSTQWKKPTLQEANEEDVYACAGWGGVAAVPGSDAANRGTRGRSFLPLPPADEAAEPPGREAHGRGDGELRAPENPERRGLGQAAGRSHRPEGLVDERRHGPGRQADRRAEQGERDHGRDHGSGLSFVRVRPCSSAAALRRPRRRP